MLTLDNVKLRAVKKTDSMLLFDMINEPDIVRFNAPYKPVDEIHHEKWLENLLADSNKVFFIIESDNKPVGSIQLIDIHPIHRNAELTVRIGDKNHRGKGIGSKALKILCRYAFKDLGLVRVWLRVFSTNELAIAAYKKAGFSVEGKMEKAAYIEGRFVDVIVMGLLA